MNYLNKIMNYNSFEVLLIKIISFLIVFEFSFKYILEKNDNYLINRQFSLRYI